MQDTRNDIQLIHQTHYANKDTKPETRTSSTPSDTVWGIYVYWSSGPLVKPLDPSKNGLRVKHNKKAQHP